jgi:hypothetical protein
VVVTSLIDSLTSDICLKSLIHRVNEDLRRDEMRISPEMELHYFSIITKLLQYNRLKLEDSYAAYQKEKKETPSMTTLWEPTPNLINIMNILDRMSFTRVIAAITRLSSKEEFTDSIWIPMMLYCEMISYLRILLLSSIKGHHEIAIGALYRLFYTNTEKLDPLPKLLKDWKLGKFPKKHLFVLINLIRGTILTLEAARNIFLHNGIYTEDDLISYEKQKRKLSKQQGVAPSKREMDYEQYLLSSFKFNIDEYFKNKLVSNSHIFDLYMRLLGDYLLSYEGGGGGLTGGGSGGNGSDSLDVRHFTENIYFFLNRCYTFNLEKSYDDDNISSLFSHGNNDNDEGIKKPSGVSPSSVTQPQLSSKGGIKVYSVNLCYMLFHIKYFIIIESILNSSSLHRLMKNDSNMKEIVTILKAVIACFKELSLKNHLLFVELLFTSSHIHEHCLSVESVYDAMSYAKREQLPVEDDSDVTSGEEEGDGVGPYAAAGGESGEIGGQRESRKKEKSKSLSFDEELSKILNESSANAGASSSHLWSDEEEFDENTLPISSSTVVTKKKLKKNSDSKKKKSERIEDSSSSNDSEDDNDEEGDGGRKKKKKASRVRTRNQPWTTNEDSLLSKYYHQFLGKNDIFINIKR